MIMKKFKFSRLFLYIFLFVVSFLSIFPFLWMIIGTTNNAVDIIAGKMTFGPYLAENMSKLFADYDIARIMFNSFKITVSSVILILLFAGMAGFGFQFYSTKVKERVYGFLLATMMIPFAALMIPLFQIIVRLKLINSHMAVIIVSVSLAFMVFFFRQSFASFPVEILQAARIDGASEMSIYFRVFMPSMKSTYYAAAIYSFLTSWNLYLWPLIVLQTNDKRTTTLLISSMSSSYTPEYGVIMCAIVLATLPVAIIFFAFQKQFVQGMLGSVKQ